MFEILKVDIKTNENNSDNIFIEYMSTEEDYTDLTIKIVEKIFEACDCEMIIKNVQKNVKYWVQFNTICIHSINNGSGQLTSKFDNGLIIDFIHNDNLLYRYDFDFFRKKIGSSKPVIWVVGDSHVAHLFKGLNNSQLDYGDYQFKHHSIVGLSLNRFLSSNNNKMIEILPIKKNDIVTFLFGEIDLRKTILKNYNSKKIPIDFLLYSMIHRYHEFYKKFTKICKNTFILSPNGVVLDKHINDNFDEVFEKNSEDLRVELWGNYHNTSQKIFGNNYIDFTSDVRDENNFILQEFLIENNHHLKSNKLFFDKIYENVKKNYIT